MEKKGKDKYIMKKILTALLFLIIVPCIVFGGIALVNRANAEKIYDYIDTFSAVEYETRLEPSVGDDGVSYFVTDGDFKVLQLTDLHF